MPDPINRRDFFLRASGPDQTLDISCERLFMRLVDARMAGTADQLLERVRELFATASALRLHEAFWLDREELRAALEPLLRDARARGGRVEYV